MLHVFKRHSERYQVLLVFGPKFQLVRSLYAEFDRLVEAIEGDIAAHFIRLPRTMPEGGGLRFEVAIDGIVVWERRDLRVSRFFAKTREAMARGEIRRGVSHGHPYWIRTAGSRR
jgi:hypothetical protein